MNIFDALYRKLKSIKRAKCKYWRKCPHYDSGSITCTEGGIHCGMFRWFDERDYW